MSQSEIAAAYSRFAEIEAKGRSALYEALARGVAGDRELLAHLADLPPSKRQPNLLLAAARQVAGVPSSWASFRTSTLQRWDEIRAVILARSTQTNEPGRCAVLLPVLARLPQPLALIEVGASAGLCLLADRYGYGYDGRIVRAPGLTASAPIFPCRVNAATPIPDGPPTVAWRAGLDLNPLDLTDADQMTWLQTLVWPEQTGRAERLRAAIAVGAAEPPRIVRGDLRQALQSLVAEAPAGATIVVFHTAVLAYVQDEGERAAFARLAMSVSDVWISNEAPGVFPEILSRVGEAGPRGHFLMAVNGVPVAWTDPHGAAMDWIADGPLAAAATIRTSPHGSAPGGL